MSRSVGLLLVTALAAASCGGRDNSGEAGSDTAPVTTEASVVTEPAASGDDVLTDEQIAELVARGEALLAMDPAEQQAELAAAGLEVQRQLSELSGLTDELGGPDAAEAALAEAWAPIIDDVLALEGQELQLGFRSPAAAPSGPTIAEGTFGGYMVNALGVDSIIQSSRRLPPGKVEPLSDPRNAADRSRTTTDPQITGTASLDRVDVGTTVSHTSKDGVQTDLTTRSVVTTCPGPDGVLSIEATLDVAARRGRFGQTGRFVVTATSRLSDDARPEFTSMTTRAEFADFSGGKGKYVDVLITNFGTGWEVKRFGGAADDTFLQNTIAIGHMVGLLLNFSLRDAVERSIESGRCVQLDPAATPGPKGLQPSATSTITVTSTSKLDGQPTGGTYMATLTDGGASVDPSSSFVAIDAEVTYLAPDEVNQSGTVALESRSRRGVGKATITFDTSAGWKIDQEFQGTRFVGVSCESELGPWTIEYTRSFPDGELLGTFAGTFDQNRLGTFDWSQELVSPFGRVDIGSSQRAATLTPTSDGFDLTIQGGDFGGVVTGAPGQQAVSGESDTVTFQVLPAGAECAPPG